MNRCGNKITLNTKIRTYFLADEEIAGKLGMKMFVHTRDFKALNIGFGLDEGIATPNETFPIFYGERSTWRVYFKASGNAGHGSLLLKNTAGEKLRYIIDRMFDLRQHEVERLENHPNLTLGDVTTINLVILKGGVQSNVIPPEMTVCFDVRIAIDVNQIDFENQLIKWCEEAGGGIELMYEQKNPAIEPTKIDDNNIFWVEFKKSLDELKLKIKPEIFPAGTDSRYIRGVGIPVIGFSPMNKTPILLHDHDEFLNADIYLQGIEIYKMIIPKIANA